MHFARWSFDCINMKKRRHVYAAVESATEEGDIRPDSMGALVGSGSGAGSEVGAGSAVGSDVLLSITGVASTWAGMHSLAVGSSSFSSSFSSTLGGGTASFLALADARPCLPLEIAWIFTAEAS